MYILKTILLIALLNTSITTYCLQQTFSADYNEEESREICVKTESCHEKLLSTINAVIMISCDQCFSQKYSVCTRVEKLSGISFTFCDHNLPSLCQLGNVSIKRNKTSKNDRTQISIKSLTSANVSQDEAGESILICSQSENIPELPSLELIDVNRNNFSLHVPNLLIRDNFNRLNINKFLLRLFCPKAVCSSKSLQQRANKTFILKQIDLKQSSDNFTFRKIVVQWDEILNLDSDLDQVEESVSIDYFIEFNKTYLAKDNVSLSILPLHKPFERHSKPINVEFSIPATKKRTNMPIIVLGVVLAILLLGMLLACLARRHASQALMSRRKIRTVEETVLVSPYHHQRPSNINNNHHNKFGARTEEEFKLLPLPSKISADSPSGFFGSDSPETHFHNNKQTGLQKYETLCQSSPSIAIPLNDLDLLEVIGQGRFGPIKRGYVARKHECMVHCAKAPYVIGAEESKLFLEHLDSSIKARSHPNVIAFVGVCGQGEDLYVAVQLENGQNLRNLLRESRTLDNFSQFAKSRQKISLMSSQRLLSIALGVARGMGYLEDNKVLHDNLASINIIIGENGTPKIGGFGMALISDLFKRQTDKEHKPLRWMPPETLKEHLFSLKSQVWSFGVVLWEIVTLGAYPYCTMDDRQVVERVANGLKLHQPGNSSAKMYQFLALKLWHFDPDTRPNFHEIQRCLHDFNLHPEDHINLTLTENFTYEPVRPVPLNSL